MDRAESGVLLTQTELYSPRKSNKYTKDIGTQYVGVCNKKEFAELEYKYLRTLCGTIGFLSAALKHNN